MSDKKKKGKRREKEALKPGTPPAPKWQPKSPEAAPPAAPPKPAETPVPEKVEPAKTEPPKAAAAPKTGLGHALTLLENAILAVGFTFIFGSMILGFIMPGMLLYIREIIAQAIDVIVSPITRAMPFYIVVLAIATIVTVFSTFIQKYTMDWELMRRVTLKNQLLSKELREAQLAGNKTKVKKLQDEQMAGMQEQTQLTKMQFKPMGFLALISFPLFIWAWWYLSYHMDLTMTFPFAGVVTLAQGAFLVFPWWVIWSILCSFSLSYVVRKAFNVGITT